MYSTDNEEKSVVGKRFIKLEGFMKKICKRQIKQSLNCERNKEERDKLYVQWKLFIIRDSFHPEPDSYSRNKSHLSNYATKSDIEKATGVDASKFAEMVEFSSYKIE